MDKSPELDPQADTAAHAAEVRACQEGQDRIEVTYRSLGHESVPFAGPHQAHLVPGHNWEANRPLELDAAPPPRIAFSRQWDAKRGRFCQFSAAGTAAFGALRLLRARLNY